MSKKTDYSKEVAYPTDIDVYVPQPHGGALRPFQPGQSGNPAGKPKGAIHLSTRIQQMLNDPEFTSKLKRIDGFSDKDGVTPMEVIAGAAMVRAANGDSQAREWLAKYGYGQKLDVTSNGETLKTALVQFVGEDGNGDS